MTIVQRQCLLMFLGYYDGPVDGIWGERSRGAAVEFQKEYGLNADGLFGPAAEEAILEAISGDSWWADIRWFTREEFACKCGKYCDGYPARMKRTAVLLADRARAHFGAPAIVVSGLRCESHNAAVGGVENSQHMSGEAIDLRVEGVSAEALLAYLREQPELRYAYAINAANVHLDVPRGGL